VLHVNIRKRKTAHWSLFCDESMAGFDAFSVVEPYITKIWMLVSQRFQSSGTGSCSSQVQNKKERRGMRTEHPCGLTRDTPHSKSLYPPATLWR
jgi:hypothetical protein